MTFSLIGRCERTGMFGIAIATSEMAVGSRCIHVAPGVGAIVTPGQHQSAPRPSRLESPARRVLGAARAGRDRGERSVRRAPPARLSGRDGPRRRAHRARQQAVGRTSRRAERGRGGQHGRRRRGRRRDVRGVQARRRPPAVGAAAALARGGARPPAASRTAKTSSGLYVVDRETYAMVDLRVDLHPSRSPSSAGWPTRTSRWSRTTTCARATRTCRPPPSGWPLSGSEARLGVIH